MILFIALPIVSVFIQSLHIEHEQVILVSESCDPFGCTETTSVDTERRRRSCEGSTPSAASTALAPTSTGPISRLQRSERPGARTDTVGAFFSRILNLPFYKALAFTLTYTFVVTPFVLVLGLAIAVGVNNLPKLVKGPTIFVSLLPMIVTPLVGSLILFWMVDGDGIIGATLQRIYEDNALSLKASPALTWIMLIVYGVWHILPFSFIVFYAGLQTVPRETLESAMIDGATKWQRIIHVVVPHLMPIVIFVTLILLMDNFRVFEPIVGFSAEAHAQSLSWIIFKDLRESANPLYSSAGATSMMTILGVAILLTPVLIRTWRDFRRRSP